VRIYWTPALRHGPQLASAKVKPFAFHRLLIRRARDRYGNLGLNMPGGPGLRRLALGFDQLALDEAFGDLNRIERRALAQIVRDAPQPQDRSLPSVPRGCGLT